MSRNYFLGIDLGTTNSSIAWGQVDPKGEQIIPKVIDVEQMVEGGSMARRSLLPSSVYFAEGKTPMVGDFARSMAGLQASRVVRSIKSSMGTDRTLSFDGEGYSPAEISSIILRHLAQSAQRLLGFLPQDVVITVPASFDSDMRKATLEAAEKAGFKVTEDDGSPRNILLDEPRAALYDFVNRQVRGEIPDSLVDFSQSKNVMVFDLGGGTLDISLHKVRFGEESQLDVEDYAISRYTRIGGDNFDRLVADRFMESFGKRVPLDSLEEQERLSLEQRFIRYAEEAKMELVTEMENRAMFGIVDGSDIRAEVLKANVLGDHPFEYDLSYDEFLDIVSPLMGDDVTMDMVDNDQVEADGETIMTPVVDVLLKAKDKAGELPRVDVVLLNGGMTRLPAVRERIGRFFGVQPVTAGDPDMAVVRGAVAYHYNLHRGIRIGAILNDTIGIEIAGGRVKHIAPAGAALPYRSPVIKDLAVTNDGATFLDLPFYLGRRTDIAQPNRQIASRRVRFVKPLNEGDVVCLQVSVDERSIMSLEGWPEKDRSQAFTVTVQSDGAYEEKPTSLGMVSRPVSGFNRNGQSKGSVSCNGPALNVHSTVQRLVNLCDKAPNPGPNSYDHGDAMKAIKDMEKSALMASNGEEFIPVIMDYIGKRSTRGLAKSRLILLLGDLGSRHPRRRTEIFRVLKDICAPERIYLTPSTVVNTIFRYAVEAIGKVGDRSAEEHLLRILATIEASSLWSSALFSLGKIGGGEVGFQKALSLLKGSEKGVRISSLWSIAMMGSRERGNVSASLADDALAKVVSHLEMEDHDDAIRNGLFAMGELGDRRPGRSAVSEKTCSKALKVIAEIRQRATKNRFGNSTTIRSFCDIATAMIKGEVLSQEQEKSLLGLRSMLG